MRERFEKRTLTGAINVKMDDAKGIWRGDKEKIVAAITMISNEYQKAGYVLTLRQLYYQLVARDIVPNHDKVYNKISAIKDDVVYSGLVDWDVFEDRGRIPIQAYYEDSVEDALSRTISNYYLDRQRDQENHIEVWTEKDAISSILRRVTDKHTIRLVVNKGYTSSTAIYAAYERFINSIASGQKLRILYFGDHDPSGIDMIRDIKERLMFMFCNGEQFYNNMHEEIDNWWDENEYTIFDIASYSEKYDIVAKLAYEDNSKAEKLFDSGKIEMYIDEKQLFEVIPVGLTMDQINLYKPPHNPAKITDPRAKGYIRQFGKVSWEVDALKPEIMIDIVQKAINQQMNHVTFEKIIDREIEERNSIKKMLDNLNDNGN